MAGKNGLPFHPLDSAFSSWYFRDRLLEPLAPYHWRKPNILCLSGLMDFIDHSPLWYTWRNVQAAAPPPTHLLSLGYDFLRPFVPGIDPFYDFQFKIDQVGLISGNLLTGSWAQGKLVANNNTWYAD